VFLDFRVDQLAKMRPEPFVRAFLVRSERTMSVENQRLKRNVTRHPTNMPTKLRVPGI